MFQQAATQTPAITSAPVKLFSLSGRSGQASAPSQAPLQLVPLKPAEAFSDTPDEVTYDGSDESAYDGSDVLAVVSRTDITLPEEDPGDPEIPAFARPVLSRQEETISELPELKSQIEHKPVQLQVVLPSLDLFGSRLDEEIEAARQAAQRNVRSLPRPAQPQAGAFDGALRGASGDAPGSFAFAESMDDLGMEGLNLVQLEMSSNGDAGKTMANQTQYLKTDLSSIGSLAPEIVDYKEQHFLSGGMDFTPDTTIEVQRPVYRVTKQDTLDDVALLIYGNARVGHLIADINAERMDEVWRNGTRIIVLRTGQNVHLPINTEIQDYLCSPLANQLDELVTVVIDR